MAKHLNLVKLCVGADRVEDLTEWQDARFTDRPPEHVTRMWPRRAEEVLAGGSLYWVFRGRILARQVIRDMQERRGADGILRCALILDARVIRTEPMPRRPFQGWRYFDPKDAPRDLRRTKSGESLPGPLMTALAEIGLR